MSIIIHPFLKYNYPSITWAGMILIACLMPGKDIPDVEIVDIDKAVHFSFYLVLSLMLYYGWKKQNVFLSLHKNTVFKIMLITFAYGFFVEIMQGICTTDRHFELSDALANAIGGVSGSLLGTYLKLKPTHREK